MYQKKRKIDKLDVIEIIQIPLLSDNYSYIIIDKNTKITACIDPSVAKDIVNVLQKEELISTSF